jgi:ABC-type polysaccharide/polyol phosphate export permease
VSAAVNSLARVALRGLGPVLGDARARAVVGQTCAVVYLVYYYLALQYARAALGLLWVLLTPAIFLAVYLPVLLYVFRVEPPPGTRDATDYALFLLGGFLPWGAFAEGFGQGSQSIVANTSLVRHSPTPPALLPVIKVTAAFVALLIGTALFVAVLAAFDRFPGVRLVLLPAAVALLWAFTLGVTWFTSSVSVYLRDVLQVVPTVLLVEFFAAPIVYAPSQAPGLYGALVQWNPLTPFLALFRAAVAPSAPFAWWDLGLACGWTALALLVGAVTFRRLQDGFGDSL